MARLEDLSPEQRLVAESWGKGLAVLAGAGSGKTTTLVVKCAELLKRKPNARFAAVSFTERSASDLRSKLTERLSGAFEGEGGALSGHWVMTIHGLCAAIIGEFPREAGYDGDESMLSEGEATVLWERACEGLWFDEVPPEVEAALAALLERESRAEIVRLVSRGRELAPFGALESLERSDDPAAKALAIVSRHVAERFGRLKRRRGAMDFNDLETGADRALENETVRDAFRKRFDLVLVDEFQDTNPLQSRIITRFCKADLSNLCVVGDPKQSIYRFRDADVGVFEEFCSRLPERLSLTWNFRSRPGIIQYANRVCAPAFGASEMLYEALEPRKEENPEFQPVCRLDVSCPAGLAEFIREESARGVPLESMALLVRRIRGNEQWFKALTAAGIPIALGSGGLFWEDPRVRELVSLLKWWDDPANVLSGAVFLRSPWVAVPDATLDAWVREDKTFVKPFFASDHPAAALAAALAPSRGLPVRPGELLLSLLINDEIERELGSALLGLWHRCEDLSSRGMGFREIALELARAIEESRRERDVPPPRNQGQLQVLTFHSSKGLEFEHVILIDLGAKGRSQPSPLLFWDRERGARLSPRDSEGERNAKDPVESAWRELEASKNLAESKRLFYVALTRARERLVLVCPELDEKVLGRVDPDSAFTQDWWRAWIEVAGAVEPASRMPGAEKELSLPRRRPHIAPAGSPWGGSRARDTRVYRPRHAVTEWNLLARCPRAYEWKHVRPRPVPAPVEPAEAGLPGPERISRSEIGTAVHACLEKLDWNALRELEARIGAGVFSAEALIAWAAESPLMRLPAGAKAWSELAFEIPVPKTQLDSGLEALVGTFDRVVAFPGEAGSRRRFRIVDFKVSSASGDPERLIQSYKTQMQLYAAGLRALHPAAAEEEIGATLVAIGSGGVREIEVPGMLLQGSEERLAGLASEAERIISGQEGVPRPGSQCRFCDFRSICESAAKEEAR